MRPTLLPGDLLVGVGTRSAALGDIVVARVAGRSLIKRVATSDNGSLTILGDNPVASTDSRHFGSVPATMVEAIVIGRIWPKPSRV